MFTSKYNINKNVHDLFKMELIWSRVHSSNTPFHKIGFKLDFLSYAIKKPLKVRLSLTVFMSKLSNLLTTNAIIRSHYYDSTLILYFYQNNYDFFRNIETRCFVTEVSNKYLFKVTYLVKPVFFDGGKHYSNLKVNWSFDKTFGTFGTISI